jgi:hypothetical protein
MAVRSENLGGQVVMRRAAAAWRRLLFCQNLGERTPPLPPACNMPEIYYVSTYWMYPGQKKDSLQNCFLWSISIRLGSARINQNPRAFNWAQSLCSRLFLPISKVIDTKYSSKHLYREIEYEHISPSKNVGTLSFLRWIFWLWLCYKIFLCPKSFLCFFWNIEKV